MHAPRRRHSRVRAALLSAASVALLSSASAFAAPIPAYYDLGFNNTVSGLSADGTFAAGTNGSGYFTWTAAAGLTPIGGVSPSLGGGRAKVSDGGNFVVGTAVNASTSFTEMSVYDVTAGSWTNLGGLGGESDGSTSSGWGISGDGNHVVGLGWIDAGTAHAIQSSNRAPSFDLGSTVAERSSRANATNIDGTVVVGWQDAEDGFRQGAVWINGVQQLILDSDGNTVGEAGDVSADGNWAIGSHNFTSYRWSPTEGFESIGPVGDFFSQAAPTGISADGSTIVGYQRPFGPPILGRGFIWTVDGGHVDLTDLVLSLGIDLGGVVLALPLEISADGTTISGLTDANTGFVVVIPEPASAALLVPLTGLLLRRRGR